MPSGGTTNCGIWKRRRACARDRESGRRRCAAPVESTTARSMTFSSSRTLPGQSYSISRSSASGVSSRSVLRFSSPYFSRKCCTSSGMSSLRSRSGGSWIDDDVQPVEQVLAEPALLHHLPQVDVGGGDDADVDLDRLHAAEAHELALLDHAQQLGLRLERDVADLVEEDAALVGEVEQALLRVDGAGERALHVAEERRLEQVRRQVAGVDGDERPVGRATSSCGSRAPPAPCRCRSRPESGSSTGSAPPG